MNRLPLMVGTALLCVSFHWRDVRVPGTAWLRSFGRLSYEVYLTHMFVVFGLLRFVRALGGDLRLGFLWYLPATLLSWLLGWSVARWFSGRT